MGWRGLSNRRKSGRSPPEALLRNFSTVDLVLMMAMQNEAFESAVLEQKNRVYTYAAMLLRDPIEAQDVTQETMIRLWQHKDKVETEAARFWLRRTAHNLCVDRIRRSKSRPESELEPAEGFTPASEPGPERLAESVELGEAIQAALAKLSTDDRAVLILREVQGLPYDEIAYALDVPLGTLKARLHRARENLRRRLTRAGVAP